jgi:hypothetical protein
MIIILASRWDTTASALAAHWAPAQVAVITPRDLCGSGWRQQFGGFERDTICADFAAAQEQLIPQRSITGVFTRLPWVTEGEVVEIGAHDRAYVAAEMSAFLLFWLARLRCPVLNRPTPMCLSGPYWRPEHWVHVAARAGIPVQTVHRDTRRPSAAPALAPSSFACITVVGRRVFGDADPDLLNHARRLAELAEVALLTVRFSGAERGAAFMDADTFPALSDERLEDAALEHLCPRAGLCQ